MEKRENFDKFVFLDKLFARWEKEDEQIKRMIENDEYIKWLEDVTNRVGFFFESELHKSDRYNLNDEKYIGLVNKFYECIDLYAKINYLYPENDLSYTTYVIKYGENNYSIGKGRTVHDCGYYCAKNIKTECDVIQYEDFKNNVLSEKSKIYTKKLKELEEYIIAMNEIVSLDDIESTCNNTIEKIKSKKNNI